MAQGNSSKDAAAQETLLNALDSIKRLLDESERKNPLLQKVVEQVEEAHIPVLEDIVVPEAPAIEDDQAAPDDELVFEPPEPSATESEPAFDFELNAPEDSDQASLAEPQVSIATMRTALEVLRMDFEQRIDEHVQAAVSEAASRLKAELAASLEALAEELASSHSSDD